VSGHRAASHLLVYRTAPLDEEWEITGSPRLVVHAATSATDTDWLAELAIVGADGVSRIFDEGIVRARYRTGRETPQRVEPGAVEEYVIPLRPISVVVKPGERIEIVVTG